MKAIRNIPLALLLAAAILLTGGRRIDLRPAMAQFDQALIPAMDYAMQGNSDQAKKAVFFLEHRWQRLRGQLQGRFPAEEPQLCRIDEWLADAYYAIDANCPYLAANQMEHAKYELMVLRGLYDIPYYLDGLYDFQGGLEVLAEAACDEQLCLMEWGEVEHLALGLQREWRQLMLGPEDPTIYGLDKEGLAQLRFEQRQVAEALQAFVQATAHGSRAHIEAPARQLQAEFMDVLRKFGDYRGTQSFFAGQGATEAF